MQVHRALATAVKVTAVGLILLTGAAVAIVGVNLGLSQIAASLRPTAPAALPPPAPGDPRDAPPSDAPAPDAAPPDSDPAAPAATPAEVLAARFPEDAAASQPTFSVASVIPAAPGEGDTFDLSALSGMATVEPPWPATDGTAPAWPDPAAPDVPSDSAKDPAKTDSTKTDPAKTDPAKAPPAVAPRRSSARSPYVVNDAMIASIKRRLRLSAEQEKLWLPVEAALRKLVYTRAAMNAQRGQPYIDPASADLRELKSAAAPFVARLNEEQRREVRDIIHVMGIEAVASQF